MNGITYSNLRNNARPLRSSDRADRPSFGYCTFGAIQSASGRCYGKGIDPTAGRLSRYFAWSATHTERNPRVGCGLSVHGVNARSRYGFGSLRHSYHPRWPRCPWCGFTFVQTVHMAMHAQVAGPTRVMANVRPSAQTSACRAVWRGLWRLNASRGRESREYFNHGQAVEEELYG